MKKEEEDMKEEMLELESQIIHPESLSVAQLVGKIQRLEVKLSGVYDQINIMKETFKKEMVDQERRIKADAEERIKEAEENWYWFTW